MKPIWVVEMFLGQRWYPLDAFVSREAARRYQRRVSYGARVGYRTSKYVPAVKP